jgi:hypothetical protein
MVIHILPAYVAPIAQEVTEIDYYTYSSLPLQTMFSKKDYAVDKHEIVVKMNEWYLNNPHL